MSATNIIQPTYANWKLARTAVGGSTYYIKHDFHYMGIVVQLISGIINVYLVEICRTPEDPNVSDFETNIKPTAILKVSVDDAISAVVA